VVAVEQAETLLVLVLVVLVVMAVVVMAVQDKLLPLKTEQRIQEEVVEVQALTLAHMETLALVVLA
tara:strand:- start:64 stop:261 length:198 start_codon:yes stop_codon:yes gene_type:complete